MDAILHKMNLVVKKKKFKFNEGEKEINIDNILYIESKLHKLQFYIMEDKIKIYNCWFHDYSKQIVVSILLQSSYKNKKILLK